MRRKKNFVLLLLLMVAMVHLKASFTLKPVIKVHVIQTWESWGWFHPKGKQRKQTTACPCMSPFGKCVPEDRLGPPGIELATGSCHWDLQAGKGHLIFLLSLFYFFLKPWIQARHPWVQAQEWKMCLSSQTRSFETPCSWSDVSAPPPCPSAGAFEVSLSVEWEQLHHRSFPLN